MQRDGRWEDQVRLCSLLISALQLGHTIRAVWPRPPPGLDLGGQGKSRLSSDRWDCGDCPSRASRPCPRHRYSGLDSPHGFYLQKLSECQHPTTFSRLFNSDNCCYCVLSLVNLYTQSYLILPAAFWGWAPCLSHFADEESKAQRDSVTCPRSHSCWVTVTGFELRPVWFRSHYLEPPECCLSPETEGNLMR